MPHLEGARAQAVEVLRDVIAALVTTGRVDLATGIDIENGGRVRGDWSDLQSCRACNGNLPPSGSEA
jgi:hypothetical protein